MASNVPPSGWCPTKIWIILTQPGLPRWADGMTSVSPHPADFLASHFTQSKMFALLAKSPLTWVRALSSGYQPWLKHYVGFFLLKKKKNLGFAVLAVGR